MSIVSGAGWRARFKDGGDEWTQPIVVWKKDEENDVVGLVVPRGGIEGKSCLVAAWKRKGFVGYEQDGESLLPDTMEPLEQPI